MLTLGVETSCDETGVAVTSGREILANAVTSSVRLHKKYGGVVPEIASRYHVEYIIEVLGSALRRARKRLKDIDLVAVTEGPGLVGSLLTGISVAKSLSYGLGRPIIGVNHVLAHIYSVFLGGGEGLDYPFIGLVVSGGHTALFLCEAPDRQKFLGQTQDDAAGEAFDKVAKTLGLGYPGGPAIEKAARSSEGARGLNFPKSYLGKDSLDFSFSGIKTAVLYYTRQLGLPDRRQKADISRAFQEVVSDMLTEKAMLAATANRVRRIVVAGGVAANKRLREKFSEAGRLHGAKVFFPKLEYCLDNGAMVAALGEELYKKGHRSDMYLTAKPNLEVNYAQ